MRGQVLCRCRARVRAVDLAGPGETVSALKKRALALSGVREPAAETWTRIVHEGRWLADESSTLAEAGVGPGSTVELAVSRAMRGGGGDGGATGAESRSCYLEMYADGGGQGFSRKHGIAGRFVRYSTQSTVRDRDEREEDFARWFNCTLTEEPLDTRGARSWWIGSGRCSTRSPCSRRCGTSPWTARCRRSGSSTSPA